MRAYPKPQNAGFPAVALAKSAVVPVDPHGVSRFSWVCLFEVQAGVVWIGLESSVCLLRLSLDGVGKCFELPPELRRPTRPHSSESGSSSSVNPAASSRSACAAKDASTSRDFANNASQRSLASLSSHASI